ncbi:condensin complex subunit 1 [Nematocida sp. LUAm3]|nr:condensin complex subunit 1 [Nematocida sp. LUAm3]KAI5174035.1 condensin complex subunit 1 [Nematocida sp. LUAm2]KAI5177222.1 condensin complex subunit 1 [Nematocida sp. LUAm1]
MREGASENEVERLLDFLREKKLSEEPEKYGMLLESIHAHSDAIEILKMIFRNVDNSTMFLGVANLFFLSMDKKQEENGRASLALLRFSRDLCMDSGYDYDLLCKIGFSYLEKSHFKFLETKNELFTLLEEVTGKGVSILSHSLNFLLTEQPVALLGEVLLFLGGNTLIEVLEYVIEEGEVSKNTLLHKNIADLLVSISEKITTGSLFEIVDLYVRSISSEIQGIRNSSIEAMRNLSMQIKKEIEEMGKGEKELFKASSCLRERLWDISPFCRAKSIHVLTEMAREGALLRTIKEQIVEDMLERIKDKTHIVRKKALLFFKTLLEVHPFVLDGGALSISLLSKYEKSNPEYYQEATLFYRTIEKSIDSVRELLYTGAKGEVTEIIQYISRCLSYGIEEARCIFPDLFSLSWNRVSTDGKTATDTLCEEIVRIADRDLERVIELVVSFDDGKLAYEGFVRELALRGILGMEAVNRILQRIEKGKEEEILSYLQLLRRITSTERSATEAVLEKILFLIENTNNIALLGEGISLLGNLDYRVGEPSKIIDLLKSSIKKASGHTLSLAQSIIDASYLISIHPDQVVSELLEIISSLNDLPLLIFSIGHIAIKHAVHLERVESAWSTGGKEAKNPQEKKKREHLGKHKEKRMSTIPSEIRERRLSVGSRRNSSKITNEEEEEMADRVFFSKEHEILFGEGAALAPFVPLVEQSLESKDPYIQRVSLVSLGKFMVISSEYNRQHMDVLLRVIREENDQMKKIALMILSDSIMAFSSLLGDASLHLFSPLQTESSSDVQITALVLIRHLYRSGMIKLKNMHWNIAKLLSKEEEVKEASFRLLEQAMEKESPIGIVCEIIKSYVQRKGICKENKNNEEDPAEKENGEELAQLVDIVKFLVKAKGITDPGKKIEDWSSLKNDVNLLKVCTILQSEFSRTKINEEPTELHPAALEQEGII